MVWTPFNMVQSVSHGSKTLTFQYDADHNRVMQTAPEGTTYYLPDGEQTPGAMWHTYFQVDGQRIAEDYGTTGALKHHYFHNDDQATIGLVTDDTFNVANYPNGSWNVQNEGSAAFGQPRAADGSVDYYWGGGDVTRRRWINQEDLADVQLIDLNARLYDPAIAKFLSPDPVISDQDDSQSWNAYAYSHNNPMSKSDPTGLADCLTSSSCTVIAPKIPEGGPNGAHEATVFSHSSPAPGHVPSGIQQLVSRAAQAGPHSAPAHMLAENYNGNTGGGVDSNGNAFTFAGVAGSIAASVNGLVTQVQSDAGDDNTLVGTVLGIVDSMPGESLVEKGVINGGKATVEAAKLAGAVIHGNSKLSPIIAYLYKLFTKEGEFLKNGVTQNPLKRYTTRFMTDKNMELIDKGGRADMLAKERQMTISDTGPLNKEPWAGPKP